MAKTLTYKFRPDQKRIAQSEELFRETSTRVKIARRILRGDSHEEVAEEFKLDVGTVVKMQRETVRRWAEELTTHASDARSIDLMRIDRMLKKLEAMVFPDPVINGDTGKLEESKPDMIAMSMYLKLLERRAAILGYDSKEKLQPQAQEVLQRQYLGVPANSKGEIDL
jgi:hypothetical protein